MDDFFEQYFSYVGETECPLIYHRWCAISLIAATLGRQVSFKHGHNTIYPNFYTMLIGSPGTRKSTAIKIAGNIGRLAGNDRITSGKTSKEKFLADMEEGFNGYELSSHQEGVDAGDMESSLALSFSGLTTGPKEVWIVADEFTDFIGANNAEFISLLGTLWDCPDNYSHRIKSGKSINVIQPVVNILSGNTPTGFATAFPPEIIGQGLLSRLLLIYGESTGSRITFPLSPTDEATESIVRLCKRFKLVSLSGVKITPTGISTLERIYMEWSALDDSRLKSYSTRRFTHLIKLCLICTAARFSNQLDAESVIYANSILSFAELNMHNALGEFGKSKNSDVAGKILQFLEEQVKPIAFKDLWKVVHQDLEDQTKLVQIMTGLEVAEKIMRTKDRGFLIRKQIRSKNNELVNFDLLMEAKKR